MQMQLLLAVLDHILLFYLFIDLFKILLRKHHVLMKLFSTTMS